MTPARGRHEENTVLETMRNSQRWLTGLFVAVIGAVFVFFIGLGGPLTDGGPAGNAIIKVGDIKVVPADFYRARDAQLEQVRERFPDSLDDDAIQSFLDTETIRQLTDKAILAHAGMDLGLQVTRAEIQNFIREIPQFRGEDGRLDIPAFEDWVEYNYGSQRTFMDVLKQDLMRSRMVALIYSQPQVSEAEARDLARRGLETVKLGFVALDSSALPSGEALSDQQIEVFLTTQSEAVRSAYSERVARYARPEARRARHILVRSGADDSEAERVAARERVEALHQKLREGAAFEDLALEFSEDEASRTRGGDIGEITRGATQPALEEALFTLAPGGETQLVETDAGFSIVRVDEVIPERTLSFEEVSLEIAAELAASSAAKARARDRAERISQAVVDGASLEDAARDVGAQYQTSASLQRRADSQLPGIGASQALMAEAFSLSENQRTSSRIFAVGPKWVLIEWRGSDPIDPRVLESEALAQRAQLLTMKRNTAVNDWIDAHRRTVAERGELQIDTRSVTGG
jgi:peptidyl-prolyl cis-trans isomerase D